MSDAGTAWTLQDAKAHFSAVVDAALGGEAQVVTRRGKKAVVVVAAADYERLVGFDKAQAPGFIDHLLAIPKEAPEERAKRGHGRADIKLRDFNFK